MAEQQITDGLDPEDFIRGQSDCRRGVPADLQGSESYQAGYGAEYQLEQINSNQGGKK